jgi:ubiquinone/menaquinone biosynthesis C-methylase UbiE
MPSMSTFERAVCQSAPWRVFTGSLVLPWALQGVKPCGDVLEIGSGSGTMAARVMEAFPDARLTAIDVDPAMVRDTRKRLARFTERASVREASATELPFEDQSFDVVLSFIMLHHVVEWERAFREALRVLRPGGVLVGYDLLSTAPLRLLHRAEGQPFRMMTLDALRRDITVLPVAKSTIRSSLIGFTVRFVVTKSRSAA